MPQNDWHICFSSPGESQIDYGPISNTQFGIECSGFHLACNARQTNDLLLFLPGSAQFKSDVVGQNIHISAAIHQRQGLYLARSFAERYGQERTSYIVRRVLPIYDVWEDKIVSHCLLTRPLTA